MGAHDAGHSSGPAVRAMCALVLLAVLALPSVSTAAGRRAAATVRRGTLSLRRCSSSPLAYCGSIAVPLDHASPSGPRIAIAFRFYPASGSGPAAGTVVPVEGGPGYPLIGSVLYRTGGAQAGYAPMYGPLLAHWNMLAVDARGTGASTPLRCDALQNFSGPSGASPFEQAAGECAAQLDRRWRYPDGGFVHASDLFTSAAATADLAEVLQALDIPRIDLYGDSYGSFFAQAFAARYPARVRSLILDSTYQTQGLDPWYRSTAEAMPGEFEAACRRAPACAQEEPEPVWTRLSALAASLRSSPLSGVVPGRAGGMETVTMGVTGLVDLLSDGAEDPQIYGELDAAARTLLQEGDPDALLRLYAQRLAVDEAYFGGPPAEYSVEDYLATSCQDYPQLFSLGSSPSGRQAQLAAAEAALPAATFAPFSTAEWIAQDQNTEAYTACLDWPAPEIAEPPTTGAPPLLPASLPVLVLGGELDTWTPPAGVPAVLAQLGGSSRFVELANSTHVVGEGQQPCASELIRAFVAEPQSLQSIDASCAPAVAPVHSVGAFPDSLEAEPPAQATPGSGASPAALRLAAAAVHTAGDAIARWAAIEAPHDRGLHGGSVVASHGGSVLALKGDQLVPGVSVSGMIALSPAPLPEDGEAVVATLRAQGPAASSAKLSATWTTAGAEAVARVAGVADGSSLSATLPAP